MAAHLASYSEPRAMPDVIDQRDCDSDVTVATVTPSRYRPVS